VIEQQPRRDYGEVKCDLPTACGGRRVSRQHRGCDGARQELPDQKAVAEYIETQRWQLEEIRKSIAEADAGKFATDEEVEAVFREFGA